MRTALRARLGEISIVLHAGDARCGCQEGEWFEQQLPQATSSGDGEMAMEGGYVDGAE